MSRTKTKRMVASFLLLCLMSGTKVLADPTGWNLGDNLSQYKDNDDNVIFNDRYQFSNYTNSTQGALYVAINQTEPTNIILNAVNNEFKDNQSKDSGAAVYLGENASLTINGTSDFVGNKVSNGYGAYNGGAIYTQGATINFEGKATFNQNTADGGDGRGRGGAISGFDSKFYFNGGSKFTNNTAATDGGALIIDGSSTVTNTGNTNFSRNTATNGSGGAVYVDAGSSFSISGGEATFSGNTAGVQGGAIYSKGEVTLDSNGGTITFDGNKANGAKNDVYLAENGSMSLSGTNAITFNGSIQGEDGTTITNSANDLILYGDNTDYAGIFTQTGGKTTVNGKFFGGTNVHEINGGSLVIAAANAIDGSKIEMGDGSSLVINQNTVLNGNVTGSGVNVTLDNADFQLIGTALDGNYTQNSGNFTIGDGSNETTSFSGTNKINGGSVTVTNNATMLGTNTIQGATVTVNQGGILDGQNAVSGGANVTVNGTLQGNNTISGDSTKVDLKSGSTLAGTNIINGGTVNINTSDNTGAANTINGGVVNVGNEAETTLAGTNTVASGELKIFSGSTLNGAKTSLTSGAISLDNAVLNDLKAMTGGSLTLTNASEIQGTVKVGGGNLNMTGGSVTGTVAQSGTSSVSQLIGVAINGTYNITEGEMSISQGSSIGANGVLDIDGGTVNMNQSIALTAGNITGNGGDLIQEGAYELNINGDLSSYQGNFIKSGNKAPQGSSVVNVNGGKLFGGTNNFIYGSVLNLTNNAQIVENSTVNLGGQMEGDATLNVVNSTINGAVNAYNKSDINLTDNAVVNENITLYNESQVVINDNTTSNSTVQLNGQIISDAGSTTSNVTLKGQNLDIKADQSGFKGTYTQEAGITNVEGGSLFGGTNNIKNGVVNMKDDSSLAEGSTLQMSSGTTINIENTGANHNAATNNIPAKTGNETVLSGAISSEVDKAGAIKVTGENTYLVVDADMSDYTGSFTQDNGATTEVTENGVFFAGTNVLNDGHFIFRDNAQLGGNVTVASKDVHLAFGDGSQGYKVEEGNHVYYYNSDGSRGKHSFIMNYVTITDSLDGGQGVYKVIDTDFGSNGGFANTANYNIKQQNDGSKTTISFRHGSVAQDGAQLNLADVNTEININADYMEKHATSSSKDGVFGADISGIGTVNVYNTNSKDKALTFISDNSGFSGTYYQTGGSIRFEGQNGASHFFDGENELTKQSCVAFGANSVIHGTNYVDSTSTIVMEDGSSIDINDGDPTRIILQGGTLSIENTDKDNALDLNISVENNELGGNVNKTGAGALTISADQHEYTGNYTQTGEGKVTVKADNSFFGGKNNISNGIVDLTADDAKVAGQNTISSTSDDVGGKMQIGDLTDTTTHLDNPIIVNTVESDADAGLELVTTDRNSQNLEVAFAIASGADNVGRVTHSGNGTLNLNNAGADQNDLFEKFKGTFAQTSTGVTNVFGNSFKNNDIQNGTLNMKNGSTLVDGSTNLGDNGTLNIGAFDGDTTVVPEGQEDKYKFDANSTVTIASDVKGKGSVNISGGKTTITDTSDNSGLTGTYHQTGGEVVAQSGSTFFGAKVKNLIEKGKLFFNKGANLASGANVTLVANTDMSGKTENTTAVLDLDGRDNAKFTGGNTLYIDGKDKEGFVFTDGILQNALLHGEQNIGDKTVITMQGNSGFAGEAKVSITGAATNVVLGTGSVAQDGSTAKVGTGSTLGLVASGLDYYTLTTGDGSIRVEKDMRETNAPDINIYNDQSAFAGSYYQDAGRVTVKEGATFFGGDNAKVTGIKVVSDTEVDEEGNPLVIKETSGDLYLEKGSFLGGDITVTNSDKSATAGVSTAHGRVFVEDKIFTQDGKELTDIDELIDQNNLYYNNILKADGTVDADSLKQININNGGLILSNGTIFETTDGPAVFERKENGIIDIGFSNGTGVDGDIVLKRDTMLSYGDNAYIKDDSTLEMEDTAILNFINDKADITYRPDIVGGGSIYKEGLAATNITSAIDMTGEVKVSEGTLNFTNKDKVIFKAGNDLRQTGDLIVGSNSSNAVINIVANETEFQGDVTVDAQDGTQSGLGLKGKNTTIGGNLTTDNTNVSIFGNSSIGYGDPAAPGNWNVNGNSSLNLAGNYANTIDVAGDLILGSDLKDGKLPVSFDYDPHRGAMDTINVDSFVNDSNSPLLITGINFVTSPVDRNFDLSADRLIQQRNPEDTPYYDATSFYANTAMGRYFLSNGAGGADFTGTLVHLNPQQYRGQVATIASWQNQLLINNLLFDHMGLVTRQLMEEEKTANKYAATIPQFAPYQYDLKGGSLWYKAYGNFETLSMTKGLSVGNNAYGGLIGADFPLIKLKHGWNIVPTAYIGYNGAHQHFNGVSMYQNGAQLGFMGTAYKGNFLTSLLAYGGGYGNDMSMHGEYGSGSDNTGNWFAGVASKSAYNIHLPADFILQPTVMAAYNAFGSQNWGSDFGVMSMSSGMLNGVNVAPGVNLIWQKKSFNIYLTAQMVYNIMGGVDGRAGNIDLGYVRMRHSYFEYGLGVSKNFKDRFGGFLQFVIRNGGRTGIGFSGGLQIKLGK